MLRHYFGDESLRALHHYLVPMHTKCVELTDLQKAMERQAVEDLN